MGNAVVLKDIGFTEGEIKVYEALFELGQTTVGPISEKSGVTHAKVYPILDKLVKKGLVSHVIKEGRKNFSPNDPDSLLEFVDERVRSLNLEKERIKKIIPSLVAKKEFQEKVQYSRVYEGFRGLRSLFYELFGSGKDNEIRVLGLNEYLKDPGFISFFRFYHDLRKENKVKLKLILNKNMKSFLDKSYVKSGMYSKGDAIEFVDVVFPTGVFIYGEHVVTIVADEHVTAFDIKSKQNAERYKKFFDSIFENG